MSAPSCKACGQVIEGQSINALDATWHVEHFVCAICNSPIGDQQFRTHEGRPVCDKDFAEKIAPKCCRCSQPIMDQVLDAVDAKWHSNCFTCQTGNHVIPAGTSFHVVDAAAKKVYCPAHFEETLDRCNVCKNTLKGEFIKVADQKLHNECYRCNTCKNQISGGDGGVHNGQFICTGCFNALQAKA